MNYGRGGGGGSGFVTEEYKKGWYDGYQAARRDLTNTQHHIPPLVANICRVCSRDMSKLDAYVCNVSNCPTKTTC